MRHLLPQVKLKYKRGTELLYSPSTPHMTDWIGSSHKKTNQYSNQLSSYYIWAIA